VFFLFTHSPTQPSQPPLSPLFRWQPLAPLPHSSPHSPSRRTSKAADSIARLVHLSLRPVVERSSVSLFRSFSISESLRLSEQADTSRSFTSAASHFQRQPPLFHHSASSTQLSVARSIRTSKSRCRHPLPRARVQVALRTPFFRIRVVGKRRVARRALPLTSRARRCSRMAPCRPLRRNPTRRMATAKIKPVDASKARAG